MSVHRRKTRGLGGGTEATLFRQAQCGNPTALNQLMTRHDRLVHAIIRRHGLGPLSYADTLQAGRIGLWHAIRKFDPTRGWAFSTYAWPSIMRHICRTVKVETRPLRDCVSIHRTVFQQITDPAWLVEQRMVPQAVQALVHRLPPRLQQPLAAHYGLAGDPPANFAQIGRQFQVSEERARQWHQEALIWLRQPAHSPALRSLVGRHTLTDYQALEKLDRCWWRSDRARRVSPRRGSLDLGEGRHAP